MWNHHSSSQRLSRAVLNGERIALQQFRSYSDILKTLMNYFLELKRHQYYLEILHLPSKLCTRSTPISKCFTLSFATSSSSFLSHILWIAYKANGKNDYNTWKLMKFHLKCRLMTSPMKQKRFSFSKYKPLHAYSGCNDSAG